MSKETVFEKLARFEKFEKGWAFGEGEPFHEAVIMAAHRVLDDHYNLYNVDVFPGRDGTVTVSVYLDGRSLDFVIGFESTTSTSEPVREPK